MGQHWKVSTKAKSKSVSAVEICQNGIYHKYEGKDRLEAVIKNSLSEIFKLTKGTTMRFRQLQQDFRILGNTAEASKVMEGTYVAPEGSSKSVVGML